MRRPVLIAAAAVLGLWLVLVGVGSAHAERRVALVIGNSAYQHADRLPNPTRDAAAMAKRFEEAGFEVVSVKHDVGNLQFKRAIRRFEDIATGADIAVVFYAGHGIEIDGVNYLIPVDAKLASDRDVEDETITLGRLAVSVEGAERLRLVILDACRDNPFVNMKRQRRTRTRQISPGLAAMGDTPTDTLVAYAAKDGTVAEDGFNKNSPFTIALLEHLFTPGLDVRLAFGRVRDAVLESTNMRQEPYVYGSLGKENVSIVPAPQKAVQVAAIDRAAVQADYQLVEKIGTERAWKVFLQQYPTGFYSDLARQQIETLAKDDRTRLAALPSAKPPVQRGPSSEEQRAWDRIKDLSNPDKLKSFIKRYPASVLANTARLRLDALERAAEERDERERAEREAKAAERARLKAEREAKRAEEERREQAAREAARKEAEREAKERAEKERAAKAAREAAWKKAEQEAKERAEQARKAKLAAEAARKKAEREAKEWAEKARKARLAAEAARKKAEREAKERAEQERKARLAAEAARKKAEREAKEQAEDERKARLAAEAARKKAERAAALKRADEERRARLAEETARKKAERLAALRIEEENRQARLAKEEAARKAACKREEGRLAALKASGKNAVGDLKKFSKEVTCDSVRPSVLAAIKEAEAEAAAAAEAVAAAAAAAAASKAKEPVANTRELVRAAQTELVRIGCLAGRVDGKLGRKTRAAIDRYMKERGTKETGVDVTEALVTTLKSESSPACPPAYPVARDKDDNKKAATKRAKARKDAERKKKAAERSKARKKKAAERSKTRKKREATRSKARRDGARSNRNRYRKKTTRSRPKSRVRQQARRRSSGGGVGAIGVGF